MPPRRIPSVLSSAVTKFLESLPPAEPPAPPSTGAADASGAGPAAVLAAAVAAAAGPAEPVYDQAARQNIQGNILPGFNKDHQHYLFLKLGRKPAAKKWLKWLAPRVTSMDEALAFVRMYRGLRARLGTKDVPLKATWVNVAFSHAAISALTTQADADAFGDESFRQGLAERSEFLGDPTARTAAGNKQNWKVGGPRNEADVLVVVAADAPGDLADEVKRILAAAEAHGLTLVFQQRGEALPGALRGHEHFGFKDGVSQPGVRGMTSPTEFLTRRFLTDDRARMYAKPGQALVWPGEFLLGEPRQNPESLTAHEVKPEPPPPDPFPAWAKRGSYLVCRRLRQDVRAFWAFAAAQASALGMPPERFASLLVGRWPSGAPVMRTPAADNPVLAADDLANNHFLFNDDTRPSALKPIPHYPGDTFPAAVADVLGRVCPHFAHIRKVNPRDDATDLGKPGDTLLRTILRRGIAFGPPVVGVKRPSPALWKKERGLVFVSYQASIENQFEFLQRRWSNSSIQPNFGGHDPVIGQHESYGDRGRFIDVPHGNTVTRVPIAGEWVTPTGGGYFFAPPIAAISDVFAV